ncbi:MAG: hypothetical protein ACI9DF_002567 [Verrucomicrobiales bacterium]
MKSIDRIRMMLDADEAIALLDALRASALYRENQDSYILYPDRQLPGFLAKNTISDELVNSSPLLQRLLADDRQSIVTRDVRGGVHFNGAFRNSADLRAALAAIEAGASPETIESLRTHYYGIKRGIGAEKSPTEYGAFPSDPYSHTPENAGVKQPGMTGQVKEDILARFGELGVHIVDGSIRFRLSLFDKRELLVEPSELTFYDLTGESKTIEIPAASFGFTLFQVPIIYQAGESDRIEVRFQTAELNVIDALQLDAKISGRLFDRSGTIERITCFFKALHD